MHYACAQGHLEIVQFILEHPKMKPDYLKAMDDVSIYVYSRILFVLNMYISNS
ncbi:hypothetical protein EON65_04570 [archaeon]|nr:MAG: hypothetical protein EON65_04570 [archaeon]